MTREEAITKIERIIKKANEYGESENLFEIYIFGSFARGSKNPHDCDILLIFKSDKNLIFTKKEKSLKIKFGGRISKVDMLICSTHDFDNYYPFVFNKETLIKIWTSDYRGWKEIISNLPAEEKKRDYIKPIQSKLFKMYPATLKKVEFAFSKSIIQIKEIDALEYLNLKEKWVEEQTYWDENENMITEEIDAYEELTEYLTELEKEKVNKSYIRTLKLMYVYAYKNNYFLDEYYNSKIKDSNGYETYFYADSNKVLFIIYNPNFENVFFQLKNNKSLRKIVIIPWVRANSKDNFIYEIKRGKNWRKTYLEKLYKIYYNE
jgi:predicted nucleotidyltransferase